MLARSCVCLFLLISFVVSGVPPRPALAADPKPGDRSSGKLPTDANGKSLNFDFETGDLKDWVVEGEAFKKQPIQGDTVAQRRGDMKSNHAGKFWIGGYEVLFDQPLGTLTSVPFIVQQPFASFLVAGGPEDSTCVDLVRKDTGKVIFHVTGDQDEALKPVVVDLTTHVGKEIFIRLVDKNSGGWGHLNFDDFRIHETRPNLPQRPASLTPDVFAHSGLTGEEAAKAMTVPEGFQVSLFAGEPDVQQPISMAIDDKGRLWVAEAYSYPIRLPEDQAKDRIIIFEDTNRDGKFDTRKVFADKLNLVSGMEIGFGGVFVGAAPEFLFIPDLNGDDIPDGPPQVLLDGWGYQDTHETLNSFIWGPDGWLYGCHGVFTHSRVGKPGTPDEQRIPINAGIWRYHPTRQQFEVFAQGTSNPWGVDFNDRGQAFATACVIPHLYHIIQGGRYQRQAGPHFNPYTFDDIKTIAKHRHWVGTTPHSGNGKSDSAGGGHAHAGAMVYLGGHWPATYRDQLFMNNIHGARLNVDQLAQEGSGYTGDRSPDFLFANDVWSQVLYLTYGPDGNVYMIDWYDRNQCHHGNVPGHDRSNGRIFKISFQGKDAAVAAGATQSGPVEGQSLDLKQKTDLQLVELQLYANDWYVRHARRILQERAAGIGRKLDSAPEAAASFKQQLTAMAFSHPDETRRLRGLWALHAVGQFDVSAQLAGLKNDKPYVRGWSIQLATEQAAGKLEPAVQQAVVNLATTDPSQVVRLYLASAAPRLPPVAQVELTTALLKQTADNDDHNLPLMYWYAAESVLSLPAGSPRLNFEQISNSLILEYAARRVGSKLDPVDMDALLVAGLKQPARSPAILAGLLRGLEGYRTAEKPAQWDAVRAHFKDNNDPAVQSLLVSLGLKFGDPEAIAARQKILTDPQAKTSDRRLALESLVALRLPSLPPLLQELLSTRELVGPALRGLAQYDDPKTAEEILKRYPALTAEIKRDALNTLASRAPYAVALLTAVEQKKIVNTELSADLIRQMRSLKSADVDELVTKVWGTLRDTPEEKARQISAMKAMLRAAPHESKRPQLSLGRAVFVKTCQQCHTLFGTGGKVGPELTGSNRANLDYILSNIIDPSAQIGKDYQVQVILTKEGRTLNGIVKAEDQNSVTLVTANETVVVPKGEIEERITSEKSMMADEILKPLNEQEIRSLVAYLASPGQVPLPVSENAANLFFNGKDLIGWTGNPELWKVENGEIVGQTAGLKKNEFLCNELLLEDFRFEVEVKLVNNEGNSGIQLRSELLSSGVVKGYQADIGIGWWGKLYEEDGRGLLWDKSGEAHVKAGEWNKYEIVAVGNRVRTWINGQPCVDLEDSSAARSGIIAFQLHSGGKTEVHFRNLKLTPLAMVKPAAGGAFLISKSATLASAVKFKKTTLEQLGEKFRSEGVGMGDFNNDGLLDIAAGSMWYEAPDWTPHSLLEKPNEFDRKTYSNTFCNWSEDLDGDGLQDLIVVDFPGKQTWWFQNPGRNGGPWRQTEIVPVTNNESPTYLDVDGDGRRELIYGDAEGRMCFARPGDKPFDPWKVTAISSPKAPSTERFSHGLGVGDINRDGVNDIIVPQGWWQGPTTATNEPWTFHKAPFGEPQAQMFVYDFDGDDDNDVVGSSAHRRGIWWYEQTAEGWKTHEIDKSIAQTHAMSLADMNGDGLPDLVTGKRYYAHNGRDPGEDEPPYLAWYELQRVDNKAQWVQHLIDEDSGVGTHFETYDMNGDGLLDVIVANKRGVYLLLQTR